MTVPTIFETCEPREDVLKGTINEADFAADLAQVIIGKGNAEYLDPARFFANTYPTRGLKNLLANVCRRLSGAGGEVAAIFRLDTSYGGGKTHGLIALTHAARGMKGVSNIEEFVDISLFPKDPVSIAAFDGENADPANGRAMGDGVRAFTPWGEIAFALAGKDGYALVRKSDESHIAPGAETLRELFGGEPTLILLDELSVYLRKVYSFTGARNQLTAFLTSLFKAVENAPGTALVYTLAIGKDGRAADAYTEENQFIADKMAEAESVSARKATLLNPTEEDETVQVLRRRLFKCIGEAEATRVVDAYRELWTANRDSLEGDAILPATVETFRSSYPLHPDVLKTLTGKTATLGNFQRVRGMLRLLARTIAHLWEEKPDDATAIHVHHIDPSYEPIRQEIVTRLEQSAYAPVIDNDIGSADKKALAQEIDAEHHGGMPPYTVYVARTVFLHTLAFNDPLKGILPKRLRYSVLGPTADISFIEEARKKFIAESAYLDDHPGAPMRFLAEANLLQIIRREERHIDAERTRIQLDDRIREIFGGETFETVLFPGGPFDVPDKVGNGRTKLVIMAYDGLNIGSSMDNVPDLIVRIYARKGSEGSALRALRNNLVFVVADEALKKEMKHKTNRCLALQELKKPERLNSLAKYQQDKVLELETQSKDDLAIAIQQCYRHVFYPSPNRVNVGTSDIDLAHSDINVRSISYQPGAGQQQIVQALRDLNKLRLSKDEPLSPAYVRDRTPLKKKGQITTLALRDEFRRNSALPVLTDDDIFIRGVQLGIERGEYVYRRGDLLCGQGDPSADIMIDKKSVVFTMAHARDTGIWPRKRAAPPPPPDFAKPEEKGQSGKATGSDSDSRPVGSHPQEAASESFAAEGVLKEALVRVWEQVRARKIASIGILTIRMFEAGDAFRLLGVVGAISGAHKTVTITGGYETREGGSFELNFRGPIPDAQPVKEFLESQLRDASDRSLEASFQMTFVKGLSLHGNATEKLTARLAMFASGAAHVSATAQET